MICPTCGHDNLPGAELCDHCQMDLTQLDRPVAYNRVERSMMEDPVTVLHAKRPLTIAPATPIREAIRLMLTHDIGALLVVDASGKLLGIFSERDLLTRVAGLHDPYNHLPVQAFMTPNPETVTANDTVAFAFHKMDVGGYRHLPVLSDGRPVGVISVRDLLRYVTRLCREN